ncbi:MAG: hypothetical protein ABUK01_08015 [Leptospirales bacterium]
MHKFELPIASVGSVKIMPRMIYWFQMPENFKDKDKIELLQKDIWILPSTIDEMSPIQKEKDSIFLLNLDNVHRHAKRDESDLYKMSQEYIEKLQQKEPIKIVTHTTHLDNRLKTIFKDKGIVYLEKNLYNQKLAIQSIATIVNLLYENTGRANRAYLRMELASDSGVQVEITAKQDFLPVVLVAEVRDISMNGMLLSFSDENDIDKLAVKGFISIQLQIGKELVKFKSALIVRLDKEKKEAGIFFDLTNAKMVTEEQASHYSTLLYHWISEIMNSELQE